MTVKELIEELKKFPENAQVTQYNFPQWGEGLDYLSEIVLEDGNVELRFYGNPPDAEPDADLKMA